MFRPDDHEDDDSSESEILSDEDDEEEEEKESQPPAKKRRTSTFFDEEAEASDEDDEDEDEDADPHDRVKKHYTEEDIRRERMDEEAQELIRQQDRRRAQAGGNRFGETSIADMAREIEDRHRATSRKVVEQQRERVSLVEEEEEAYGDVTYTAVSQQSLVPSVSDPSLWMISCSNGKEDELIYQIMNKCVAYARKGTPLGITSAIAAQTKGKIYVESYSEPAVLEAIQNIRGLMQYSMKLVPIQDMTTVMTVVSKKKPGEWP
jgi:transcription elongation factor SPT5